MRSADFARLSVDPTTGFKSELEALKDGSAVLHVQRNDARVSTRFDVFGWDAGWPLNRRTFATELGEPSFVDDGFRFTITRQESGPDGWSFEGRLVAADGGRGLAFVMVRIVGDQRFVCEQRGHSVEEPELEAAISACRTIR